MRRVVIRCDGGTDIGMGHVVRGVALGEMLSGHFEILFILQETEKSILQFIETNGFKHQTLPRTADYENDASKFVEQLQPEDIVVLDGYHFKTDYQQKIKASGHQLVVIDDLHAWHHAADVVINHADGIVRGDYDCESYTQLCLGFDYLLLRKAFLQYKKRKKEVTSVRKCLISMGAADVNNLTQKFTEALLSMPSIEQIVLLASDVNPHLPALKTMQSQFPDRIIIQQNLSAEMLAEQIHEVDVVICPASSISLEACAVGCIVLTGTTAINQKANAKGLVENKMVLDLGDFNTLTMENLQQNLKSISINAGIENILINQQNKLDRQSGQRILNAFKTLNYHDSSSLLTFRKATESDLLVYFDWTNDPEVRRNSFESSPISLADHKKWFHKNVHSDAILMLLFSMKQHPIGQLRFIIENDKALLNYSIDQNFRGKGFAQQIIKAAIQELKRLKPHVQKVIAEVKTENIASVKSFERIGFAKGDIKRDKIIFRLELPV